MFQCLQNGFRWFDLLTDFQLQIIDKLFGDDFSNKVFSFNTLCHIFFHIFNGCFMHLSSRLISNEIIIQVYKFINRYMIKHLSSSLSKPDKIIQNGNTYNQFETFQQCPNELLNSVTSNRDSLLFSHSRKADETNKELGQVLSSISKQDWKQYQNNRGSSLKKIRQNQVNNEPSQTQFADPLAQYMISSIEPRSASHPKIKITESRHEIPAFTLCQKCKSLEEEHRKELTFLTKNNQQLYQLNRQLSEQMNQFVKKYESLQKQLSNIKKENIFLLKEIEIQRQKNQSLREKYYQRQKKYLRQKQFDLKTHQQQLKIVEKISECLHEKQRQIQSRQKSHNRSQAKPIQIHTKRAKTQYQQDKDKSNHNKQGSTMATWQGSCSKYTPRKTKPKRDLFSDQKIQIEVDKKVDKLSQEKKKIISRVIKENLTIDDLQTEIPQSALNKIGKGTVGKLTLAKGSLGRGLNVYAGSISSVPTQKKCR